MPGPAFVPLAFELDALAIYQSPGTSYSPEIGWIPHARINDWLALKLAVDGAVLKGVGSNFLSLDYQALLSAGPQSFKVDLGGGAQTWFNQGTSLLGTLQLEIPFAPWRVFGLFDHLVMGYSFYAISNHATQEFRIGGGFEF